MFYVTITEDATGDVVKRMGPMDERRAHKVADGASINLNHAEYTVSVGDGSGPNG